MSDMPEEIWVMLTDNDGYMGSPHKCENSDIKYIRTDIHEAALARKDELIRLRAEWMADAVKSDRIRNEETIALKETVKLFLGVFNR